MIEVENRREAREVVEFLSWLAATIFFAIWTSIIADCSVINSWAGWLAGLGILEMIIKEI